MLNRAGVDPRAWRDALAAGDAPAEALVEAAIDSPHHPRIFVDCTASSFLPDSYERLLAAGVSVAAANKVGFAGSGEGWERLHEVAREGGAIYYETTVGAGLPVLRTVADLAATGDQIVRLQGVLSGTLGYLCDEVMKGQRFSEAVREAHELGYTEPDPRDDLSGLDVARKLVILARSAGLELEPEAVSVEPLLPGEAGGSLEDFWELLPSLDEPMEKRRTEAAAAGGRLVYLGTVEPGKASVGLEVVAQRPSVLDLAREREPDPGGVGALPHRSAGSAGPGSWARGDRGGGVRRRPPGSGRGAGGAGRPAREKVGRCRGGWPVSNWKSTRTGADRYPGRRAVPGTGSRRWSLHSCDDAEPRCDSGGSPEPIFC